MVNRNPEVVPDRLVSRPSFNWTLGFRQQVFNLVRGGAGCRRDRDALMDASTTRQRRSRAMRINPSNAMRRRRRVFHHLITLPTYHTAALSTDNLAKEYFGEAGMLGYVAGVQRKEIRQGIACVKHQNMAGSDMGDDHKEYFSGDAALKAAGEDNTMNQFG